MFMGPIHISARSARARLEREQRFCYIFPSGHRLRGVIPGFVIRDRRCANSGGPIQKVSPRSTIRKNAYSQRNPRAVWIT